MAGGVARLQTAFRSRRCPRARCRRTIHGAEYFFNWCREFENELGNAGFHDARYWRTRIQYVNEFLDMDDVAAFGQALRQYRHVARLTQAELAQRAGLIEREISNLESRLCWTGIRGQARYG